MSSAELRTARGAAAACDVSDAQRGLTSQLQHYAVALLMRTFLFPSLSRDYEVVQEALAADTTIWTKQTTIDTCPAAPDLIKEEASQRLS
jgi:hypothetical protein